MCAHRRSGTPVPSPHRAEPKLQFGEASLTDTHFNKSKGGHKKPDLTRPMHMASLSFSFNAMEHSNI